MTRAVGEESTGVVACVCVWGVSLLAKEPFYQPGEAWIDLTAHR